MAVETTKQKCRTLVRTNLLVILTIFGAAIGFIIGFGVRTLEPSKDALMWLGMIGELYLRLLKMMILPLIISSVITGTSSLDPKSNGKISAVSLSFIMLTNFLGALSGCLMSIAVNPGIQTVGENQRTKIDAVTLQSQDIFADLLRNLFPDNLIQASFQKSQTKYQFERAWRNSSVNGSFEVRLIKELTGKEVGTVNSANILGLIIASSLFGIAVGALKEGGEPFRKFFSSTTDVIMQILKWIIWTTPIGVASLIAKTIGGTMDLADDFKKLAMYIMTVVVTLTVCSVVLLSLAYVIVKRSNPFRFLFTLLQPIMIVFATSSTAIAIPQSLKMLEDENGIDKRVTRFVVPFSATLGRCGSSVYISCSCIFISQMVLPEMDAGQVILICVLTTFSSLAIPSVTGASLITVIILLTALGIPAEKAALLFTMEWLLDRLRSVANYTMQCLGSVMTFEACKSSLPRDPGDFKEMKDMNHCVNGNTSVEHDSQFLMEDNYTVELTRV